MTLRVTELRVRNPSKIVEVLNRETTPEQWRRELFENARLAGATEVLFDGWSDPESGRVLMRVSDNGSGMNPRVLRDRIRHLADPERLETFGIGGRLATAAVSSAGVVWASRETGAPAAMVVMRQVRGRWGLEEFVQGDGTVANAVEPIPGMLPVLTKEHGTSVILYGDGHKDSWHPSMAFPLAQWLSSRYWTFGSTTPRVFGWDHGGRRWASSVPPFGELVTSRTEVEGTVLLDDGSSVRWHVLDDPVSGKGSSRGLLKGGLAVQHGDELFDRPDKSRIARFGIYTRSAQARVVLIIVPSTDLHVVPNAQRTRLLQAHGRDLPWLDWASSFVQQIPDEIRSLLPAAPSLDLDALLRRFGPEWRARVKPSSRPVTATGVGDMGSEHGQEFEAALEPPETGRDEATDEETTQEETEEATQPRREIESRPVKRRAVNVEPDGRTKARRGRRHDIPTPIAVTPEEWTEGDNFDFAYGEAENVLRYKTTGEAITRQTTYWMDRSPRDPQLVGQIVSNAYAVEMVGKILHVLDVYAGQVGWTDSLDEILSPRALTIASLGFHAVDAMIAEALDGAETTTASGLW